MCAHSYRNIRCGHQVDCKLLPDPVSPSVDSVSVPCGLQTPDGVEAPEISPPLPALRSPWYSSELRWRSALPASQAAQQGTA